MRENKEYMCRVTKRLTEKKHNESEERNESKQMRSKIKTKANLNQNIKKI